MSAIAFKTYGVNGLRPLSFPASLVDHWYGGDRQTDATLRVLDSGRQGNALRGSRSMPCKQVLLALELRRERRRLRAACAHDRCAPLLRHHNHRNRQHQRHNHDMSDDNGENDHIMIVIGERAIDLRCIWQVLDGRTKPCAVRSVMAGRSLAAVRSLGWQGEALDGRTKPCAVRSVMTGRRLATGQTI